jgi:hypothetical protein
MNDLSDTPPSSKVALCSWHNRIIHKLCNKIYTVFVLHIGHIKRRSSLGRSQWKTPTDDLSNIDIPSPNASFRSIKAKHKDKLGNVPQSSSGSWEWHDREKGYKGNRNRGLGQVVVRREKASCIDWDIDQGPAVYLRHISCRRCGHRCRGIALASCKSSSICRIHTFHAFVWPWESS